MSPCILAIPGTDDLTYYDPITGEEFSPNRPWDNQEESGAEREEIISVVNQNSERVNARTMEWVMDLPRRPTDFLDAFEHDVQAISPAQGHLNAPAMQGNVGSPGGPVDLLDPIERDIGPARLGPKPDTDAGTTKQQSGQCGTALELPEISSLSIRDTGYARETSVGDKETIV